MRQPRLERMIATIFNSFSPRFLTSDRINQVFNTSGTLGLVCLVSMMSLEVNADEAPSCHPFAQAHCALPFPSNYWTKPSSKYATNIVLDIPNDLLSPDVLDKLPSAGHLSPQSLGRNMAGEEISGFSPVSGVYFEVEDVPNTSIAPFTSGTVLKDGVDEQNNGDFAFIYDRTTGQKMDIIFQQSKLTSGIEDSMNIVELRPVSRFEPGHTYIAAITNHIKSRAGVPFKPSPGFNTALTDTGSEEYAVAESALTFLSGMGVDTSEIVNMTEFTIRDEVEMTSALLALVNKTHTQLKQDSDPVQILNVEYRDAGDVAATVTGRMKTLNYRNDNGMVEYDPNGEGEPVWVAFRAAIPRNATVEPAPVAIYGHGLGGQKEMMDDLAGDFLGDVDLPLPIDVIGLALNNAALGMATIAIDFPNHGERILSEDEFKADCELDEEDPEDTPPVLNADEECVVPIYDFEFEGTRKLDKRAKGIMALTEDPLGGDNIIGIAQQGAIDLTALLAAIQSKMNTLDVLPAISPEEGGDGIPDLDVTRIIYQGTSLGSVFGAGFVAMAPDIKGAYFQVGGAGITNVLLHSDLWGNFGRLVPEEASPADALFMVNMYQLAIDAADGLTTAHWIKNPPQNIPAKSVLLQYGIDDRIVPNISSVAYGLSMNAPLLDDRQVNIEDQAQADLFSNGSGIVEEYPEDLTFVIQNDPPLSLSFLESIFSASLFTTISHASMVQSGAIGTMEDWVKALNVDSNPEPEEDPNIRGLGGGGTPSIDSGSLGLFAMLGLMLIALGRNNLTASRLFRGIKF